MRMEFSNIIRAEKSEYYKKQETDKKKAFAHVLNTWSTYISMLHVQRYRRLQHHKIH